MTTPLVYFLYLYHWYKEVPRGPYEVCSSCRVLRSMLCTVHVSVSQSSRMRSEGLYKDGHTTFLFFLWLVTDWEGRPKGRATMTEVVTSGTDYIYLHLSPPVAFFIVHRFSCFYVTIFILFILRYLLVLLGVPENMRQADFFT